MNLDHFNRWLEFARGFKGNEIWNDLFEPSSSNEPSRRPSSPTRPALYPSVDVLTAEDEMIVLIDLPGVDRLDIQISINDSTLYLKGLSKPLFPQAHSVTSERFSGSFERPIGLPLQVDGDTKIKASFQQGTLVVRIPVKPIWKNTIHID